MKENTDKISEDDRCRVQIAEARFKDATVLHASDHSIRFLDNEDRLWVSTEPYTIAVTSRPLRSKNTENKCQHPPNHRMASTGLDIQWHCNVCGHMEPFYGLQSPSQ